MWCWWMTFLESRISSSPSPSSTYSSTTTMVLSFNLEITTLSDSIWLNQIPILTPFSCWFRHYLIDSDTNSSSIWPVQVHMISYFILNLEKWLDLLNDPNTFPKRVFVNRFDLISKSRMNIWSCYDTFITFNSNSGNG